MSNINEIQKKRNKYNFEYFDLLPYKQNYNNNNWYLFFYLENLTNYNITLKTKYYKQIPTSHQNYIFNPISFFNNDTEFMNHYYFDSYQILNILNVMSMLIMAYYILNTEEQNIMEITI